MITPFPADPEHQYVWQLLSGTRVYTEMSDGSCYCTLGRVDGMYRNATTEYGARALLYCASAVEQAPEGYWRVVLPPEES